MESEVAGPQTEQMITITIRNAAGDDCAAIARIYSHYIQQTVVTFEETPVSAQEICARLKEVTGASFPWLVVDYNGGVCGYAYASRWKGRCAYRHTVESTVYLSPDATGRGLGSRVYRELLDRLSGNSVHAVLAGIALPNPASVALHEKCGFRKVAHLEQVGFKFNRWIDVGYWQTLL